MMMMMNTEMMGDDEYRSSHSLTDTADHVGDEVRTE